MRPSRGGRAPPYRRGRRRARRRERTVAGRLRAAWHFGLRAATAKSARATTTTTDDLHHGCSEPGADDRRGDVPLHPEDGEHHEHDVGDAELHAGADERRVRVLPAELGVLSAILSVQGVQGSGPSDHVRHGRRPRVVLRERHPNARAQPCCRPSSSGGALAQSEVGQPVLHGRRRHAEPLGELLPSPPQRAWTKRRLRSARFSGPSRAASSSRSSPAHACSKRATWAATRSSA